MPQYWRVAGLSYLRYSNLCAEYLRRVLKEPARAKAMSRAGYVMVKAEWEGGKVKNRTTLQSEPTTSEGATSGAGS
ncbi:hypothetical protein CDCA_CDCA16G4243 [Cyanidium caldarium]|uniref:Uncharacterized protein n=1 Tax=Cyanidium caldarium TaxID=2771 RepID=A0AAV9J2E8_CYACA|nr:hypothetical protein CDCA_CDCA16G4243 [Cyanidium caldarium]